VPSAWWSCVKRYSISLEVAGACVEGAIAGCCCKAFIAAGKAIFLHACVGIRLWKVDGWWGGVCAVEASVEGVGMFGGEGKPAQGRGLLDEMCDNLLAQPPCAKYEASRLDKSRSSDIMLDSGIEIRTVVTKL